MPRPRRPIELELKITELLMGDMPLAQIAARAGITESALAGALHSIYKNHGIDGHATGKRDRLQAKLRPKRPRARLSPSAGNPPAKRLPQLSLEPMEWQERFWAAYQAVCALERALEDDGMGGNRYFREAIR